MQNCIELSAAVHELSFVQRKKNSTKTLQSIATGLTVTISFYMSHSQTLLFNDIIITLIILSNM